MGSIMDTSTLITSMQPSAQLASRLHQFCLNLTHLAIATLSLTSNYNGTGQTSSLLSRELTANNSSKFCTISMTLTITTCQHPMSARLHQQSNQHDIINFFHIKPPTTASFAAPVTVVTSNRSLTGETLAQDFNGSRSFCVTDLLISLLQRFSFETLPRQTATQEVHEHVTECLEVVASTLFYRNTTFIDKKSSDDW